MTTALMGKVMGPTWARDEAGMFALPERTIGWHVIDWCEEYLLQPDGPDAGEPWRFTKEQKRFLLHWYSVDARGRFTYRAGMLRRMKGWGKDPMVAAMCCAEFLGPCRFDGWDEQGDPKAAPHFAATVQIAAVSMDQVKRNTMSLFPALFSSKAVREYELDIGREIIYAFRGRCRIELLTTSARSAEGPRPTFIVKNETQHWLPSNGGHEMSDVCDRNVAKSRDGSARALSISNAHAPGEMSDAETDYEAYMLGDPGYLYDSLEASDAVVEALRILKFEKEAEVERLRAQLFAELEFCRGDSVWLDIDRLLDECLAPKTQMNEALRFYFNRLAASEERAFNAPRWGELARPDYKVEPGALITLGFDGSKTDDWTALIATEVKTGFQWPLGIWEPSIDEMSGEWSIPVDEVDQTVAYAFDTYNVWRMNCDPFYWMEQISMWAGRYNKPGHESVVSFSTTNLKSTALATLAYRNAIDEEEITHDGDERFTANITNSHKRMLTFVDDKGERMFVLQKERPGSPLKIDAAMAGILSWWGRLAAIASGAAEETDNVEVWFLNE